MQIKPKQFLAGLLIGVAILAAAFYLEYRRGPEPRIVGVGEAQ